MFRNSYSYNADKNFRFSSSSIVHAKSKKTMRDVKIINVIGVACFLLSFVMYFQGWIVIKNDNVREELRFQVKEVLSDVYETEEDEIIEIQEQLGSSVDAEKFVKSYEKLLETIRDGALSPGELGVWLRFLDHYTEPILDSMGWVGSFIFGAISSGTEILDTIRKYMVLFAAYHIMMIGTFFIGIVLLMLRKRYALIPYAVMVTIVFIMLFFYLFKINGQTADVSSILKIFEIEISEYVTLQMSILSIISMLLGLISAILLMIPGTMTYQLGGEAMKENRFLYPGADAGFTSSTSMARNPERNNRYNCIYCGSELSEKARFCPFCGRARGA